MNRVTTAIYRKLSGLEREIQKLKLQAYFSLPKKEQRAATYSEEAIMKALKSTRSQIWLKRYARKIKNLS